MSVLSDHVDDIIDTLLDPVDGADHVADLIELIEAAVRRHRPASTGDDHRRGDESRAILVWKEGGITDAEWRTIWLLAQQMAVVIDDGSTPFDVDGFTDNVAVAADNVEPGWGRPVG